MQNTEDWQSRIEAVLMSLSSVAFLGALIQDNSVLLEAVLFVWWCLETHAGKAVITGGLLLVGAWMAHTIDPLGYQQYDLTILGLAYALFSIARCKRRVRLVPTNPS